MNQRDFEDFLLMRAKMNGLMTEFAVMKAALGSALKNGSPELFEAVANDLDRFVGEMPRDQQARALRTVSALLDQTAKQSVE